MTKNKSNGGLIAGIVALILVAIGLAGLLVFALIRFGGFSFGSFGFGSSDNLALEKEFELEDINLISSTSDAADIHISKGSDEKAKVKILAESDYEVSAEKNEKNFDVLVKNRCRFICFGSKKSTIDIVLPENYSGDFKIRTDAGGIVVDDFEKSNFDVKADAGDFKYGKLKSIVLEIDAGKIDIDSAEKIDIKKDAGDLHIGECTGELYVKSDAGNIDIDKLSLTHDSWITEDAGNIDIDEVGDVRVNIDKTIGNSDVRGGNPKSDITLNIKTDVGNINIR